MPNIMPWNTPWPPSELEAVASCPVCGDVKRNLIYDDLVDNVFHVANGRWQLYQCLSCSSAYLDPRPSRESIHKAYRKYYTHTSTFDNKSVDSLNVLKRFLRPLTNGYCNHHHGTHRAPASKIGAWLLLLYPLDTKEKKAEFRYLPKPRKGQSLLDIGCGNGDFLALAAEVGWNARGLDTDPIASGVARSRGFDVTLGDIERHDDSLERYDAITMSHVIEHVHSPKDLMRRTYKLLKPGGSLYIDTPNIESSGATAYKQHWRGFEAPRHLVLFSRQGLKNLFDECGFIEATFFNRQEVSRNIALKSFKMAIGKSPYDVNPKRLPLLRSMQCVFPRSAHREEFLTVMVKKPL